ncbi:MAG: hypothetical protein ACPL1Z_04725 [Candidatus Bathyarchaeales archaeon]
MELYVAYASIVLFTMSCLSLVLSLIFRLKFNRLMSLKSADLSVNVFNKTFVVFDPYPDQRRIIHSYILIWPFIVGFAAFLLSLLSFLIIGMGLALVLFTMLVGINLVIVEDGFEVYRNSKLFINAVGAGCSLGVGDLKFLSILKLFTRKLSCYYFVVGTLLFFISLALPYIFTPVVVIFCQFIGLIIQSSAILGAVGWQFTVFLFSLSAMLFEFFVTKIKDMVFKI